MAFSKSSNFGTFFFLTVIVLLTSVLGTVSSQDEDIVCPDEPGPDEYFYPHPDCSKYYVCQHGHLIEVRECSIGLYFNPRLNECDFPDAVPECVGGTRPPPGSTTTTTIRPTTDGATETPEIPTTTTAEPREWVVIQRRGAALESGESRQLFNLSWVDYVNGFGDPEKDFWLGLGEIARLTQDGNHELQIDMIDFNLTVNVAHYDHFQIGGEEDVYRLNISGFSGNTYDAMAYHNGMEFSTYDIDNDAYDGSCSTHYGNGGWWYNSCAQANLNGIFYEENVSTPNGIVWYFIQQVFIEMKIRRSG